MRGFFGVGVEGISKELNVGNLVRSSHAFGAGFFFAVTPQIDIRAMQQSDTSAAFQHLPYYQYDSVASMMLPQGCQLVGVELTDDAVELPSFKHPTRAAYVLGPEMGSLSPEMQDRCDHIIKIPMKFCVNVGVAGALVMYDRNVSMGNYAPRPVVPGGHLPEMKPVQKGGLRRKIRSKKQG